MNMCKILKLVLIASTLLVMQAHAATALDNLTEAEGKYTGSTVEDNVTAMDTDKNGFADASEVRAFLELKHGKGYESTLLEKFAASTSSTSCGSPFTQGFYVSK